MLHPTLWRLIVLRTLWALCLSGFAVETPGAALARPQDLPQEVEIALARAKVPREAVAFLIVDALGQQPPRLSHRADQPMNPASVMKLVTTYAALDLLGPSYTWPTPVYIDGAVRDGTLYGNVVIQGQGDPKLTIERLWLLLRRLQGLGIKTIAGDIVLDQSAFVLPDHNPADFDGDPLRPYNAAPDALLISFKSVAMTWVPEPTGLIARIQYDPPLDGVQTQPTVPLLGGDCADYRQALKADFSDPKRIRFLGGYPQSCGEKVWSVAYVDPQSYAVRAVAGLWQDMGGKLLGTARVGVLSPQLKPAYELRSPPLAEIIRDINKFSNNVMAQQVFLTLGRSADGSSSFETSRAALMRWWKERIRSDSAPHLENGSGLSRQERISAQDLATMLQKAYLSPQMPELLASLPINGVDGTLRRSTARTMGSAHLKTGSLNQVLARAGYVHRPNGRRWVLVALVNHANANTEATRIAVETLLDWASKQD